MLDLSNFVKRWNDVQSFWETATPHEAYVWSPREKYEEIASATPWKHINYTTGQAPLGDLWLVPQGAELPDGCRWVKGFVQSFKANSYAIRKVEWA